MADVFKRYWFTATILAGLAVLAFLILHPEFDRAFTDGNTAYTPDGWAMEGYDPARVRSIGRDIALPFKLRYNVPVTGSTEHGSPLIVVEGTLLVDADGQLLAVDPVSGDERWSYAHNGRFVSPAVAGNHVVIRVESGSEGFVEALNLRTGVLDWQWRPFRLSEAETSHIGGHLTSPVIVNGLVIAGAGKEVYALDVATGRQRWQFQASDYIASSAAAAHGRVYISDLTHFYCLDQATGEMLWQRTTGTALYFAPIVTGQMVLLSDGDQVVALDALNGEELWMTDLPEAGLIPAAASESLVLIKATATLYALDPATGSVQWQLSDANYVSLPVIAGGTVFAITGQGTGTAVAMVDAVTGEPHWFAIESLANAAPVIAGDTLYIRTIDGQVIGLYHERSEQAGGG